MSYKSKILLVFISYWIYFHQLSDSELGAPACIDLSTVVSCLSIIELI